MALAFCMAGLSFSILNLSIPRKALCLTSGCQILQSFSIFGIGLWPVSAVLFAASLLFFATKWARKLLFCAIVGDIALLALMLAAAPCAMCLVIGFLIAGSFVFLSVRDRKPFVWPFAIWALLFVMQCGIVASGLFPEYVIHENGTDSDIYFSPSCGTCAELLKKGGRGRWHPVAESDHDAAVIGRMAGYMEQAERENPENPIFRSFQLAQADSFDNPFSAFFWKIRLWKNEARVLSAQGILPYVETSGQARLSCPLKCPHCGYEENALDFSSAFDNYNPEEK